MPSIDITKVFTPEQMNAIYDNVYGSGKAERDAENAYRQSFQDMLKSKRETVEAQRTDDIRMARINALGNILTTMVQPLGWAAGGQTAKVQPYDNRGYLEAFNRAVKANDELRNLGSAEANFNFQLAGDKYSRALKLTDEQRAENRRIAAEKRAEDRQNAYADKRHQMVMEEIERRGKADQAVAYIKAKYNVNSRQGKPIEDTMLQTAWTQYMAYKKQFDTDAGRGLKRAEETFPSFEQWLGDEYGWLISSKGGTTATATGDGTAAATVPAADTAAAVTPTGSGNGLWFDPNINPNTADVRAPMLPGDAPDSSTEPKMIGWLS